MSPRAIAVLIALLSILLMISLPLSAGRATAPYVKGELLVAFKERSSSAMKPQAMTFGSPQTLRGLQGKGVLKDKGARLLSDAGATGVKAVLRQQASHLKPGRSSSDWHQVYRVSFRKDSPVFRDASSVLEYCEQLSAEPGVEYAEPNYIGSLCVVPNDPLYPIHQQAMFTQYGLETAWDVETGSSEMIIAVIDSGIDLDHPDLFNNLAVNMGEVPGNSLDDDGNGHVDDVYGWNFVEGSGDVEDAMDHGTRVAGLIAAQADNATGIAGVCWRASLLPVKVASATGGITVDRVAAAIKYAVARGAKVINLSLVFSGESLTLQGACNGAARSAVVVAAAGNNGQNYVPLYPAGFEGVVGVAALDATGERAVFSNYNHPGINEWVDFAAPGEEMFSTFPLGLYDGDLGRGTSFAAPFVSGIAALLQAANPQQSAAAIRNQLQQTADKSVGFTTYGVINADAALTTAMEPDLRIVDVMILDIFDTVFSSTPDLSIPDNDPIGVIDTITISGLGRIHSISVPISITHPHIEDLEVKLISPSNTTVILKFRYQGSGADIEGTYGEDLEPTHPLSAFFGEDPNGTWTLNVNDDIWTNVGTFNSWGIKFRAEGDRALDPGETVEVSVELENVGADILESKLVTLTSQNPSKIIVHDSTAILPALQSGKTSRKYLNAFEVQAVSPTTQIDVPMELDIDGIETLPFDLRIEEEIPIPQMIASDLILEPTATWIVSGITSVTAGVTLSVQPGTTVRFEKDSRLEVWGTLSSVGTQANPIDWLYEIPPPLTLFAPSVELPVGQSTSLALGDVTGDGISDIVTANGSTDDVSIIECDGAGGFAAEVRYAVGERPGSVALRDVTGDGFLDIVTANYYSDDVSVLVSDGAGGFAPQVRFAAGDTPRSVALGDVTGDGIPDIVIANFGTSPNPGTDDIVSMLAGDGAGNFAPRVYFDVGNAPRDVALGEVTGDGIPDIIIANSRSDDVSILAGDGFGGFAPQVRFAVGDSPGSVALGDVTGDGTPDIVAANNGSHNVSILAGDGAGGFLPEVRYDMGSYPVVALGDVTGDGIPDIVTANQSDDVSVLVGDGAGGFLPELRYAAGGTPFDVALGDVTGDDIPDIVTVNGTSNDVSVLMGGEAGSFASQASFTVGSVSSPRSVALGDVTGDGKPDIVTANYVGHDVSVLEGDGKGNFALPVRFAAGTNAFDVALGDVTSDGIPDIIVATPTFDDIAVLAGNGAGGFASPVRYAVGDGPRSLALGDVTSDGIPDIVTANVGSDDVSVLEGNGVGGLIPDVTHSVGSGPYDVALGDVTGDGIPDIVTANLGSDDVSVLAGDGAGGFGPQVRFAVGTQPFSVALGDVTGDGFEDIVTANWRNHDISILAGDGFGGFAPQVLYAVGYWPESVALGDVTSDGIKDIVTANSGVSGTPSGGESVSVLASDGAGGILPEMRYAVGDSPRGVALGDVTGDDMLDIVTANESGHDVSVLAGDGGGGFGLQTNFIAEQGSQVDIEYNEFSLRCPFLVGGSGTVKNCIFRDAGGTGLAAIGNVSVQDSTAENCFTGFTFSATAPTPWGLQALDSRSIGLIAHDAMDIRTVNNRQYGIVSFGSLSGVTADLNQGVGLLAMDTVTDSISTRSSEDGIQARVVENSFAGSNWGIGIVASERITGCTAVGNGQGVQAPRVEDTFVLDSYGDGLVGVTDAIRVEMQENYWISSDEAHFATSILANNAGGVDLVAVDGIYIAGNEGGGVDASGTIPISNSTIIGNKGDGVINNLSVTSSNIAFNQGYGVVGGTVDGCFLKGNRSGPTSGATVSNPQSSPVQAAPAFLLDVTPDESLPLGISIHTFYFQFSGPMKTTLFPVITHGQSPPYASRVFQNATWLSPQVLRARTYIDFDAGQGWHTIRLSGAVAADGFRIPPDTYHQFMIDLEGGLVISNGRVEEALPDALHIAWDPSTGMDVEGYYVYRSFSMDGPWGPAPIAILGAAEHGYIDSPLPPDTQFFYRVMEKDTFGGFTELTNPISGTTIGLSVFDWDRY